MFSYLELSVNRVTFVFSLSLRLFCGLLGRSPAAAAALPGGMRPSPQRRSRSLRAAHRPLRRQPHPEGGSPRSHLAGWGGEVGTCPLPGRGSGSPVRPRCLLSRQTPARSSLARSQRCRDRIRSFLSPVAQTSSTDLKRRRFPRSGRGPRSGTRTSGPSRPCRQRAGVTRRGGVNEPVPSHQVC